MVFEIIKALQTKKEIAKLEKCLRDLPDFVETKMHLALFF